MLNILSGWDTANIKAFPIASGQVLDQGDWVEFNTNSGKLQIQQNVYTGATAVFPVYAGNKSFYDTRYLAKADVVTAKSGILETDKMDAVDFVAGEAVFVKAGKLTNAAAVSGTANAKPIGYAIEASGNNVSGKKVVKVALD